MYIWTEQHLDEARPLVHYNLIIRDMAKVLPAAVWLGYDREFRILRQKYPTMPWDTPHVGIYLQQLAKVSPFGSRGGDSFYPIRDRGGLIILGILPHRKSALKGRSGSSFGAVSVRIIICMVLVGSYLSVSCTHVLHL